MPICMLDASPELRSAGSQIGPRSGKPTYVTLMAINLPSIAQGFSGGNDDVPRPTGPVAVGPVGGTAGFTGGRFSADDFGSSEP